MKSLKIITPFKTLCVVSLLFTVSLTAQQKHEQEIEVAPGDEKTVGFGAKDPGITYKLDVKPTADHKFVTGVGDGIFGQNEDSTLWYLHEDTETLKRYKVLCNRIHDGHEAVFKMQFKQPSGRGGQPSPLDDAYVKAVNCFVKIHIPGTIAAPGTLITTPTVAGNLYIGILQPNTDDEINLGIEDHSTGSKTGDGLTKDNDLVKVELSWNPTTLRPDMVEGKVLQLVLPTNTKAYLESGAALTDMTVTIGSGAYGQLAALGGGARKENIFIEGNAAWAAGGLIPDVTLKISGLDKPGAEAKATLLPVDLDFIKPGTERDVSPVEIAEEIENSEGEVVGINWDDDNNSEGNGGHAKLVFKNDFDDADGTASEDDLIQLKLHKPAVEGVKARLKYDSAFVKVWLKADRKDEVKSEDTEIELTEDKIVYLEGRKLTEGEKPKEIEMQIKVGTTGIFAAGDKVSVHVATPVITFRGKHAWTSGRGSWNLGLQLHHKDYLGKNRRDDRENTVILKGKNQQGKTLWYSIDMVDVSQPVKPIGSLRNKPRITVRTPNTDKEMKMALSLEGSHVFYNGHSNYGLGPNFNLAGTSTIDDYMNISGGGKTAIIVKSDDEEDPNPMATLDHGGPNFALRPQDTPPQVTNYLVPLPQQPKYNGPAIEAILTKKIHADGTPYHYERQGEHNNWITIVNSAGDVPILRYKSCFMASCNTGRTFSENFTHGTLLYSMDETMGVIGKNGMIEGDLFTERNDWVLVDGTYKHSLVPASWGMTHYVRLLTEGKTWTQICTFMNQNQWWYEGNSPSTNQNYKHHPN